jgi:hypothetical protein
LVMTLREEWRTLDKWVKRAVYANFVLIVPVTLLSVWIMG